MFGDRSTGSPREATAWRTKSSSSILKKQALRFLCIGGASVMIDLSIYLSLLGMLDSDCSKGISYVAGMLFGFVGNKLWTFESQKKSVSEPLFYALLYACTLAVNIGLNAFAYHFLDSLLATERLPQIAAFVIATAATTVLNFLGLKYVTFRQPNPVAG